MFFDDRLATVLRQRATGEASLRTQYRQLLDLLGRDRKQASAGNPSLLAAAWLRMDALADVIPGDIRAGMIREPGWRFRNPDLASHLSDHEPAVAAAALTRADLTSEDWTALIPRLPVRARGFLRLRRDLPVDVDALLARLGVHDRGLPAPAADASEAAMDAGAKIASIHGAAEAPDPTPPTPAPPPPAPATPPLVLHTNPAVSRAPVRDRDDNGRTEISALVERIAQFRKDRGDTPLDLEQSPRLPLGEWPERPDRAITSFGFAADTSGRIGWAVSDVAPMVIGARLFAGHPGADGNAALAKAFGRRQPISSAAITLAGAPAIAGEWMLDAEPRFNDDGHFTGYVGRMRRPRSAADRPASPEAQEADRIRQLLHELRTPVTAVQGYAEVIQQQLFGPAPHEYRALAAAIAGDAARILAGFEELDRLARLETGLVRMETGEADLAALARHTAAQLEPVLGQHGAGLIPGFDDTASLLIALDPDDAEALVWRLLASLGAACAPGERITVALAAQSDGPAPMARLICTLPAKLAAYETVFDATTRSTDSAINSGLFGTGFALRLARAEARAAGGALTRAGDTLELTLPLLTGSDTLLSAAGR